MSIKLKNTRIKIIIIIVLKPDLEINLEQGLS
jgi:hypothetical protein